MTKKLIEETSQMVDRETAELIDSVSHKMACMAVSKSLQDYFHHVDQIGSSNQEMVEETGEPVVHMTTLMVGGLMTHMVNMFMRVNEEDHALVHDELQEMLKNAPRLALEAKAEGNDEPHGHS